MKGETMEDFTKYVDYGLIVGVCTSLSIQEAAGRLNDAFYYEPRSHFAAERRDDGSMVNDPNDQPCPDAPKTHRHYIFRHLSTRLEAKPA